MSNSITDILGYTPEEVVGKSIWEYFHPEEVPFAKDVHGRSVELDKAAVLNYCRIRSRDGFWVGCECVFTVVHDVLVASTSIYRKGMTSESWTPSLLWIVCQRRLLTDVIERARDAPIIRRLFSSSPRDPRYHMLSYISNKFSQIRKPHSHEPRAALFLNRFTRTLTIMYATNGLCDLLGISADDLTGKSFYFCIQENCLQEAVKCLESAKANDSIAYLRFWFRDPRLNDQPDHDEPMQDAHSSEDDDEGGVHLNNQSYRYGSENAIASVSSGHSSRRSTDPSRQPYEQIQREPSYDMDPNSRSSSGNSTDLDSNAHDAIFDNPATARSSISSASAPDHTRPSPRTNPARRREVELEAVVSCTSDGLVVVLRKARALHFALHPRFAQLAGRTVQHPYANGFFASPWANHPIYSNPSQGPQYAQPDLFSPNGIPLQPCAAQANTAASAGPATEDFMRSIREVVVFAWALTGINGSLTEYARGRPVGQAQPPRLPVWEPDPNAYPESQRHNRFSPDHAPRDQGQEDKYQHSMTQGDNGYHNHNASQNNGYHHSEHNSYQHGSSQNNGYHHGSSQNDGYYHDSSQNNGYHHGSDQAQGGYVNNLLPDNHVDVNAILKQDYPWDYRAERQQHSHPHGFGQTQPLPSFSEDRTQDHALGRFNWI